jgi:hypothetical protein
LIPVFSTTGVSVEVVGPGVDVELAEDGSLDDGWLDDGLDPADGDRELDEQALSETTAASSSASSVGPPRNRARTTLPIDFHSVVRQPFEDNLPTPGRLRGSCVHPEV